MTTNFKNWTKEEIVEWIEIYESTPQLQSPTNLALYYKALEELKRYE